MVILLIHYSLKKQIILMEKIPLHFFVIIFNPAFHTFDFYRVVLHKIWVLTIPSMHCVAIYSRFNQYSTELGAQRLEISGWGMLLFGALGVDVLVSGVLDWSVTALVALRLDALVLGVQKLKCLRIMCHSIRCPRISHSRIFSIMMEWVVRYGALLGHFLLSNMIQTSEHKLVSKDKVTLEMIFSRDIFLMSYAVITLFC